MTEVLNGLFNYVVSNTRNIKISNKIKYIIDDNNIIFDIIYKEINIESIKTRVESILNKDNTNDYNELEVLYSCEIYGVNYNKDQYIKFIDSIKEPGSKNELFSTMLKLSRYYISFNYLYHLFFDDKYIENDKEKINNSKIFRLLAYSRFFINDDNYFKIYYEHLIDDKGLYNKNYIIKLLTTKLYKKDIKLKDIELNKIYGLNLEGNLENCLSYTINKYTKSIECTSVIFTNNVKSLYANISKSENLNKDKPLYIGKLVSESDVDVEFHNANKKLPDIEDNEIYVIAFSIKY